MTVHRTGSSDRGPRVSILLLLAAACLLLWHTASSLLHGYGGSKADDDWQDVNNKGRESVYETGTDAALGRGKDDRSQLDRQESGQ
ncbi:MAG: hypothetical protein R3F22_11605 [Lysobacteraceae bacterium]